MAKKLTDMPPRNQKAVYWPYAGIDDLGQPQYDAPFQIDCRWDDKHELFMNLQGVQEVSNAKVFPDRDTPEGGVLWKGKFSQLVSQSNPFLNPKAYIIKKFEKIPDIDALAYTLIAML